MEDKFVNERAEKRKENRARKRQKTIFSIVGCLLMVFVIGGSGYYWYALQIQNRYDEIHVITVKKEGIGLRELSKTYLPEISVSIGVGMIKKANGFVSEDITFLAGQRVRIPMRKNADLSNERAILINQQEP